MNTGLNAAPIVAPDFNKAFKITQAIAITAVGLLVLSNFIWAAAYFIAKRDGQERVYVVSDGGTVACYPYRKLPPDGVRSQEPRPELHVPDALS